MSRTLREVARDESDMNRLFAERLESEVTSEYLLLALIAEMSMDQTRVKQLQEQDRARQRIMELTERLTENNDDAASVTYGNIHLRREVEDLRMRLWKLDSEVAGPVYAPMSQFSARTAALAAAREDLQKFQVVGSQRPSE